MKAHVDREAKRDNRKIKGIRSLIKWSWFKLMYIKHKNENDKLWGSGEVDNCEKRV